MALTTEQWYEKLQSWVPRWFWENEGNNKAHFRALAKLMSQIQTDVDNHLSETYILTAVAEFLEEHGSERGKARKAGEPDGIYRERVRIIEARSSKPAIKKLVENMVPVHPVEILEHYEAQPFYNSGFYFNFGQIFITKVYNYFTVFLKEQIHDPFSFYEANNFLNAEAFMGSNESILDDALFNLIAEAVDEAKAGGTWFQILESNYY